VVAQPDGCAHAAAPPQRDLGDWSREHLLSSYQAHQPPLGHLAYVPGLMALGPHRPLLFVDTRYARREADIFLHDEGLGALRHTVRRLRLLRLTGLLFSTLRVLAAWRCGRFALYSSLRAR
jgi:hypothetical protein